jgi:diguanylate cyclase (GGDEF)-like protein/PAS domain S-box-containing protein
MGSIARSDHVSAALARRALLTTVVVSLAGSTVGLIAIFEKTVFGPEIPLVWTCFAVTCLMLLAQCFPRIHLQTIATAATAFYGIYLCAGAIIAILASNEHPHLFIYLVWFFPLLTLNQLVNSRAVGRFFSTVLLLAPLAIIVCLVPRIFAIFKVEWLILLSAYLLAYYAYGLALRVIMQYREQFIVERERAESQVAQTDLLETLSDCFIAVDFSFNIVYLNEAACTEFGVERHLALNRTLTEAAPAFMSVPMVSELRAASARTSASVFESQNEAQDRWYEMRCFPRPDGMSVYFRNITELVSSRRQLEEAQIVLREQADLLDKAQDGIFVQDMEHRIVYWNKGAERLYGWTAEEATGKLVQDVLPDTFEVRRKGIDSALQYGGWYAEISQRRRDGSMMVVESRCTLVNGADGKPRAILAISTDITNRKAAEARIEQLAYYDPLTNLPNRSLLLERLDIALSTSAGDGSRGALLFIDLDDFKTTNATLGHEVGDLLLRRLAARLTDSVRKGDTVSRLTGDEFVVMLQGLHRDPATATEEATAVAAAVREASLEPFHIGSYEYNGSVSVGITLFRGGEEAADELLKRGELALFRAKALGRNAFCFFDASMQTFVDARVALESDLRKALQNREFELHYQPVLTDEGRVRGAEALLRWRHPSRGMVPPNEFIPLAEENGLIVELGRWVLETACAQLAEWARHPELKNVRVAVNVSLRQFLAASFVDLVREVLETSGADPARLTLEITESFAMVDLEDTIAKMAAVREHGIRFAIDDFGTGYSSLSRLKRLPLDVLKVDRSFVSDMLVDERSASVVRTIIGLGRNLNLHVIGEGVETEAQRAFLKSSGCESYQGFLFSPAVPRAKFEAYVAAANAAATAAENDPVAAA